MSDDTGPLPHDPLAALTELLAGWLPQQRWFTGKDQPVTGVRVLVDTVIPAPEPGDVTLHHLIVAVTQPGGSAVYQVPVSLHVDHDERLTHAFIGEVDGRSVYDALHDRQAVMILVRGFATGEVGPLAFHTEPGVQVPYDAPPLALGAEQTNTSVVLGEAAILKVYRRLHAGTNPDIEIHHALTQAGCVSIAELLGWVDGRWAQPGDAPVTGSLAILQRFLVTATDGWQLAKTSVRDLFAEGDLHADEVGGDFAGEAARLGAATAGVHQMLRDVLPTGVLRPDELAGRAQAMTARLDEAVAVVPDLVPLRDGLAGAYRALAATTSPVPVQRIHGDLHLGQVVRTVDGWKLLDFEGEPARPLAERVLLDSPLRDVAGMLRSFDYAARHLLTDQAGGAQLAYRAAEWAERNREAFCDGYAKQSGEDPRSSPVLLRAYETDKAVYEAVYEARHRPSWLPIPLAALERLAEQTR